MDSLGKFLEGMDKSADTFIQDYSEEDKTLTNFSELLALTQETLDEEITKYAIRYAWLAVLSEKASKSALQAERDYDRKKSQIALGYKSGQFELPHGIVKVTEKTVDALVESTVEVETAYQKFIEADHKATVLKKIVKAMDKKGDLIRTLASNMRNEKQGDLTVRSNTGLNDQDVSDKLDRRYNK